MSGTHKSGQERNNLYANKRDANKRSAKKRTLISGTQKRGAQKDGTQINPREVTKGLAVAGPKASVTLPRSFHLKEETREDANDKDAFGGRCEPCSPQVPSRLHSEFRKR